jgi:hypothetical protein
MEHSTEPQKEPKLLNVPDKVSLLPLLSDIIPRPVLNAKVKVLPGK